MSYNGALLFSIEGPLLSPPPSGSVRAGHFLSGFKDLVRDLGGHHFKMLEKAGIDVAIADDPDYPLQGALATAMFEQCCTSLNDELFGFHLADYQDADAYGCLTAFARSAPTLRIALERLVEFLPVLHSPGADPELVTVGHVAEYRWRPYAEFSYNEQAIQHGLLLAAKLLTSLGGRNFQLNYVTSVLGERRQNDQIERRFGCPVHGRSPANAIGFHVDHLDRPLQTANPTVFGLLGSYLSKIKDSSSPSLLEEIQSYVSNTLRSGNCTIEKCAARLSMSTRTLQKRLTILGTTFFDIVEEQRYKAAERALTETQLTLDEISDLLGYSEKSSFCRAFKRWTDLTPQMFRERETRRANFH